MPAISLNAPIVRGHGPLLHHMTISENRGIVDSRAWPAPTSYDHLRKPGFGRFAGHDRENSQAAKQIVQSHTASQNE